jgi:hypothetical protein
MSARFPYSLSHSHDVSPMTTDAAAAHASYQWFSTCGALIKADTRDGHMVSKNYDKSVFSRPTELYYFMQSKVWQYAGLIMTGNP